MESNNTIIQNNFIFVDQNDTAAARSHRARLRRSQSRTTFTLDTSLLETDRFEDFAVAAPVLRDLDDRVVERFFARWSEGQTTLGCLTPLPTLLEASGPQSAIQTAILAVAYADLAVFEQNGSRGARSYQAYCMTLHRLQSELSDPGFEASDGYLATVLTVDAYELLYMDRTEPLGIHTQAIARLLELRKQSTVEHEQVNHLWRSAYQRIHVRPLYADLPPIAFDASTPFISMDDTSAGYRTLEIVTGACEALHTLKQELYSSARPGAYQNIDHLQITLRSFWHEAQSWSEHIDVVSQSTRVRLEEQLPKDLSQTFSMTSIITYNNVRMARDQLVLGICIVKILDTLVELHTHDFSKRTSGIVSEADNARDFLLTAQPDLLLMQERCRSVLDTIPFLIGLVDRNGSLGAGSWNLLDTGVITVKSPLKAIHSLVYASPSIKHEARGVLDFIDKCRHVVWQP